MNTTRLQEELAAARLLEAQLRLQLQEIKKQITRLGVQTKILHLRARRKKEAV
jgi:hypothetical protein